MPGRMNTCSRNRARGVGFRPGGVDHDDAAALALADLTQPAAHVGRGHDDGGWRCRGLPPRISRWSVRSTSGTGDASAPLPNISAEAICLGVLVDGAGAE